MLCHGSGVARGGQVGCCTENMVFKKNVVLFKINHKRQHLCIKKTVDKKVALFPSLACVAPGDIVRLCFVTQRCAS